MLRHRAESSPAWRRAILYGAVWAAVAVVAALRVALDYQYSGVAVGLSRAFGLALFRTSLWAALFPLLLLLTRRFPFGRGRWLLPLLVNLPVTVLLGVLSVALGDLFIRATSIVPLRDAGLATLNAAVLTCWILLGVCHAWVFYEESRQRERQALELEARLVATRLELLRSQLQPHFLFNTLNAITALMRSDVDRAERMIVRLSDFLRMTLDIGESSTVPLKVELELVDAYLDIQRTRLGERLRLEREIAPELLDFVVPAMLLQPLVENAVEYAVAGRKEGGTIGLTAKRDGDRIRLTVWDDGSGPGSDGNGRGLGLSNTRERLEALFGPDARMTLEPRDGGGTVVRIDL